MFKPHEDCALGKTKQQSVRKKAVPQLQILGERLFFDISSPSTPTFGTSRERYIIFAVTMQAKNKPKKLQTARAGDRL